MTEYRDLQSDAQRLVFGELEDVAILRDFAETQNRKVPERAIEDERYRYRTAARENRFGIRSDPLRDV